MVDVVVFKRITSIVVLPTTSVLDLPIETPLILSVRTSDMVKSRTNTGKRTHINKSPSMFKGSESVYRGVFAIEIFKGFKMDGAR